MYSDILGKNLTQAALVQDGISHLLGLIYMSVSVKSMCLILHSEDQWRLNIAKDVPVSNIKCDFQEDERRDDFIRLAQAAVEDGCSVMLCLILR